MEVRSGAPTESLYRDLPDPDPKWRGQKPKEKEMDGGRGGRDQLECLEHLEATATVCAECAVTFCVERKLRMRSTRQPF
jgi:hypothetical protein